MSTETPRPRFRFNERSNGEISGDIVDPNDAPVPLASLVTAELTLVNLDMGANWDGGSPRPAVINGRDGQDVLNANNVQIDSSGHFVWKVQADDNALPDDVTAEQLRTLKRRQMWRNGAMFLFTWPNGGEFRFECEIDVVNLRLQ